MNPDPRHPSLYARKRCALCDEVWMQGTVIPPSVEGAKAVVLYLCSACDRTR